VKDRPCAIILTVDSEAGDESVYVLPVDSRRLGPTSLRVTKLPTQDIDSAAAEPHSHPSSAWTTYRRKDGVVAPADPERFRKSMSHDAFPRASAYDPVWVYKNLMGPDALWLIDGLSQRLRLGPGDRILDLGCGSALTSIFLAREFGPQVWAADLWVEPSENAARIAEAGLSDQVFPLAAEAHALPFAHAFFDGVVSVDAYHYFGTDLRYLSYLAQFVKAGDFIAIRGAGQQPRPRRV
jgi:2-polyprenyl-3-methyl-5-hydroxy-6-metoxy-1,4-benzoquinol methylase